MKYLAYLYYYTLSCHPTMLEQHLAMSKKSSSSNCPGAQQQQKKSTKKKSAEGQDNIEN